MKQKTGIGIHSFLLVWFLLDMTGFRIGTQVLVEQAYQDDGLFFVAYVLFLGFYVWKPKHGFLPLTAWLLMWFVTQFAFHWYLTIAGGGEDRMAYFSNTIQLFPSSDHYIPDLYHIVLHLLILTAICVMLVVGFKNRRSA